MFLSSHGKHMGFVYMNGGSFVCGCFLFVFPPKPTHSPKINKSLVIMKSIPLEWDWDSVNRVL